ncbi:hypothetical protein BGZ95_009128 [Linnemannia exigua]|uniref:BZIP domain-containing protein n=1 Tax=Linnemannia exigua TaxID=604196 RepID=A0AAD4H7C3_9FUNG|nr:hypothetical protein BGZ95_009128 [Linnemannia exigua]
MNFDGTPDANVEDMSNSELFQYLFKAELDTDPSDPFTQSLFPSTSSPASSSSSLSSPSSSTLATSPSTSTYDFSSSSPETISHSYSSPPPPYQQQQQTQLQQQQPQQQDEHLGQIQLFQQQPTLLPSTSFSYRQISPDMPPSMPNHLTTNNNNNNHMNLPQPSTMDAVAASSTSTDQMNYWMQRFQQLQQLQQIHHQQQQQLLSSTLFPNQAAAQAAATALNLNITAASSGQENNDSSSASPSSPASSASSNSPTIKAEIYPSPPMKDDMAMDSDSDDESGPSQDAKESSDPLKPSPSELKKMTSKERRQLRNKLSARNFRVRRKEYIGTLETQVKEARREAAELQKKLAQSELNCQFLRQELETARLSQTLFNDGRLSREHANLLASLLNPNTESFPTTSTINNLGSSSSSSILSMQELQQKELMSSINSNNMTILNTALTANQQQLQQQQQQPATIMSLPQSSMQPFVPFDANWDLSVNRAELVGNPDLDPKEAEAKSTLHSLLARYEAAKHDAEVDEQMRTELKAYHEQKLAQTYIVMPKEDALSTTWNRASQDTMFLQTMVYMMMLHLTRSLFEAATLSKTQIVNVYQTMDGTLRSQMGQVQEEQEKRVAPCKFAEWREAWIRKCWPSFYNNRQRVCELLKNGICPLQACTNSIDVDETVRKMEEGVKGKTVEAKTPLCVWIRDRISTWMRCPDAIAREEQREREREALLRESDQPAEVMA